MTQKNTQHQTGRSKIGTFLKLGLLTAAAVAFVPCARAQVPDPLFFTVPEQFYLALPPYVSDWQETTDLVACQRTRTVTDGGCWYDDDPTTGPFEYCDDPDHGIANTQVGVYVPGVGCTQWTSVSYTIVSGDGSQYGTLQDQ